MSGKDKENGECGGWLISVFLCHYVELCYQFVTRQIKNLCNRLTTEVFILLKSTRSRNRTGTILLSLDFESSASTNSAIRACL